MAHPSSRYQTQLSRLERNALILEALGLKKIEVFQKSSWTFIAYRGLTT